MVAEERPATFQERMQVVLRDKDGKIRFPSKDASWLTLFAAEADDVAFQLKAAQSQLKADRVYVESASKQ